MKLSALLAFVVALPLPAQSTTLPNWRKPLNIILLALHESRRRQAARQISRYRDLIDRRARAENK